MSTVTITTIVVVAVLIIAIWLGTAETRKRRKRFTAEQPTEEQPVNAPRRTAWLTGAARVRYRREWTAITEHFDQRPADAVGEADRLVTAVMEESGQHDEETLDEYHQAHQIMERDDRGQASEAELREAMGHYQALFESLTRSELDSSRGAHRKV